MALLLAAALGVGLFVLAESRAASPLIRLAMFRDPVLSASLAMSALVSTVMMATLVVGPFYLSRALGLDAALVGLVMSVGPLVAALTGVPAGRIVGPVRRPAHDRRRARRHGGRFLHAVRDAGGIRHRRLRRARSSSSPPATRCSRRPTTPPSWRMSARDQRGVVSGMLNLSRNLGLITGASAMGAVFALASGAATSRRRLPRPLPPGCGRRSPSRRR